MKYLALLILILTTVQCGPRGNDRGPFDRSIAQATRFLWSQQGTGGGWHSRTYGLLRSGQSLTPLVLLALVQVPEKIEPARPEAVGQALGFISKHINQEGALGRSDPILEDYPNYATSLGLRALVARGKNEEAERLLGYLRRQQFREELGWKPEDSAYGAWGMGGPPRHAPHAGHLDISMTRHVLQGLSAAGVERQDASLAKAALFLGRCQNPDGGFIFSTVVVDANKAGREGRHYRSYGTATADGVLSLLALRLAESDARVVAAVKWLSEHHRTDRVPGFPADSEQNWAEGMLFYYLAASAQVFQRVGVREAPSGRDWRKELAQELLPRQRPDGAWVNSNFLMKEDDPLIATALALMALLATL